MRVSEPWSVDSISKSTLGSGEGHRGRRFGLQAGFPMERKKKKLVLEWEEGGCQVRPWECAGPSLAVSRRGLPTTTIQAEKAPKSEMITSSHLDPECEGSQGKPRAWLGGLGLRGASSKPGEIQVLWSGPGGAVRRGNGS